MELTHKREGFGREGLHSSPRIKLVALAAIIVVSTWLTMGKEYQWTNNMDSVASIENTSQKNNHVEAKDKAIHNSTRGIRHVEAKEKVIQNSTKETNHVEAKESATRKSSRETHPTEAKDKGQEPELPIHVLLALCGNHTGFFEEVKVALKSILLNAPHNQNMHIHIMADQDAYDYLPTVWNDTKLDDIEWWQNITIIPYNVQQQLPHWAKILSNGTGLPADGRHTFGSYFRLFAHKVLPKTVEYALYMDTDVVVQANLNHLFENLPDDSGSMKETPIFVMAAECAGVMLVNVHKLDKFWEHVNSMKWEGNMLQDLDQSMVIEVGKEYPGSVELLSAPWDLTVTMHWREHKKENIIKFRPEAGIVHFNGGGSSKDPYFKSDFVKDHRDGFGLPATYFSDLPWTWARFMGKSVGGPANTGIRIKGSSNATIILRSPIKTIQQSESRNVTHSVPDHINQ
jgi:lipopolysaccharide biosynthesis glycosyltransferase